MGAGKLSDTCAGGEALDEAGADPQQASTPALCIGVAAAVGAVVYPVLALAAMEDASANDIIFFYSDEAPGAYINRCGLLLLLLNKVSNERWSY